MEKWTVDDLKLSLAFTQVYDSLNLLKLSQEHSLWVLAVFSLLSIWMCSTQRQILLSDLCRVAGWREEWQKLPLLLPLFSSKSLEGLGKQTGIQNVLCWTWLIKEFHCLSKVTQISKKFCQLSPRRFFFEKS